MVKIDITFVNNYDKSEIQVELDDTRHPEQIISDLIGEGFIPPIPTSEQKDHRYDLIVPGRGAIPEEQSLADFGVKSNDKILVEGQSDPYPLSRLFFNTAINTVAKADPSNIQEVAASQLRIINSYYQSGLQQSQQSFRWSLIWGGIGLGFLIAAVSFLLFRQPGEVALASGIGGAIVEMFATTYLYLYRHASDQLAAFRTSLEKTQQLLLANSMCENLEGDLKQTTRAELIHQIVIYAVKNVNLHQQ
jgi:TRADD-N domain-containing protein